MKKKSRFTTKEIWRHNSFSGHARMMHSQAIGIRCARTTKPAAQMIARQIEELALELLDALKERNE
jgi:hypothetical protein